MLLRVRQRCVAGGPRRRVDHALSRQLQIAQTVATVAEELSALETGATLIEQLMARRGA